MKTKDSTTALQPVLVKVGNYEINITPDALDAIAEAKKVSAIILHRLDLLNSFFIDFGSGGYRDLSPEESLHVLSDILLIRERITAIAAINILRDGEPVNVEL